MLQDKMNIPMNIYLSILTHALLRICSDEAGRSTVPRHGRCRRYARRCVDVQCHLDA